MFASWSLLVFVIYTLLICFIALIADFAQYRKIYGRYYDYYCKLGIMGYKDEILFYNHYMICKNEIIRLKIEFNRIYKIIDDCNYFYIYSDIKRLIIPKRCCDDNANSFFRGLTVKKKTIKEKKCPKEISNEKKTNFISTLLMIISILSIWGALITQVSISGDLPFSLEIKSLWIFWIWMIIPILSILFYTIYKTKRNLISGICCTVILFFIGLLAFFSPVDEISYSEVLPYEKILDISIPNNGVYYDEVKSMFFSSLADVHSIYIKLGDKNSMEKLVRNIKNSQKWLVKNDEISDLIPFELKYSGGSYYLIYNKDTKEYNSIPEDENTYSFVLGIFNTNTQLLEIYEYEFCLQNQ